MFDLPKYGDGICLGRLAALLERLGIDRERLAQNSVAVTGSNGKGSTAAFCAAIGRAAGHRTGLFTSPHLFRFNERFQVDGEPIADDDLARLVRTVTAAITEVANDLDEQFGAFEAQFVLACLHFQEKACDFAVIEAGIGGRYDPVRLLGARVSTVTSVDYEHVALLGNSLGAIACDKSDACASGGTVIYGENCRGLRPLLAEYNRNRNVTSLFVRDEIALAREETTEKGERFDLAIGDLAMPALETGLRGGFQRNNAAIAAALFWLWRRTRNGKIAESVAGIRAGLRDTRWPGRLETIQENPKTIVDVGHTPDGVAQALHGLAPAIDPARWILVIGVSADKDASGIVGRLAPSFGTIVCTRARHKGAEAGQIADAVRATNPTADIRVAATVADAVRLSQGLANASGRSVYVAGGLFVAIEYATLLRGGRAEELNFF